MFDPGQHAARLVLAIREAGRATPAAIKALTLQLDLLLFLTDRADLAALKKLRRERAPARHAGKAPRRLMTAWTSLIVPSRAENRETE